MSTEEDNMVQEPYNGEEEGMEQFFSPNSQRAPDPVSQDTAAQASQVQPGPSQQNLRTGKTTAAASKGKNPCSVWKTMYQRNNKMYNLLHVVPHAMHQTVQGSIERTGNTSKGGRAGLLGLSFLHELQSQVECTDERNKQKAGHDRLESGESGEKYR